MDIEAIKLEGFKAAMHKDAAFDLERFIINAKSQARKLKKSKKNKKKKSKKKKSKK